MCLRDHLASAIIIIPLYSLQCVSPISISCFGSVEVWLGRESEDEGLTPEGHHHKWSVRLNLTQRRKPYQFQTMAVLTEHFHDFLDSGAWPFLGGGLPCQVDSGNERDLRLLI